VAHGFEEAIRYKEWIAAMNAKIEPLRVERSELAKALHFLANHPGMPLAREFATADGAFHFAIGAPPLAAHHQQRQPR
jgi:hypothetical protein